MDVVSVFFAASVATHGGSEEAIRLSGLAAFLSIGVGGCIGSVCAGYFADRAGRTATAAIAMIVSGLCALTIGFTYGGLPIVTLVVGLVWGVSVIADSAQFSAAATELSDAASVGTALTFQMAVGFSITIVSINLVPVVQSAVGWAWVFVLLAPGPLVGTIAMLVLRSNEASLRLAGGRR